MLLITPDYTCHEIDTTSGITTQIEEHRQKIDNHIETVDRSVQNREDNEYVKWEWSFAVPDINPEMYQVKSRVQNSNPDSAISMPQSKKNRKARYSCKEWKRKMRDSMLWKKSKNIRRSGNDSTLNVKKSRRSIGVVWKQRPKGRKEERRYNHWRRRKKLGSHKCCHHHITNRKTVRCSWRGKKPKRKINTIYKGTLQQHQPEY